MKLIIASDNKGKIKEFKKLLKSFEFKVISMKEAGFEGEIVEDGETFNENAAKKARAIFQATGFPVLADDSGLEVDYLNGEPGTLSARYAPPGQRREKILKKLTGVPYDERTAKFVCVLCYIDKEGKENYFRGECEGYIGFQNMGKNGFGYDPIFMINERTSMAMLSDDEKNKISHRGKAVKKFINSLKETKERV